MKNNNKNIIDKDSTNKAGKNAVIKALKIFAIVLGCLTGLIVIAAVGITLWLTPKRIAGLLNDEAGKYIDGDVHVSSVNYHIWRSFPFLEVEFDSISIKSHSLSNLPDSIKSILPSDNENLMSCSKIKGSINISNLLKKDISLGKIEITDLRINAVQVNDSLSNFNLLSRKEIEKLKEFKIHGLELKGFSMTGKSEIRYDNIAKDLKLTLTPEKIAIQRNYGDAYTLATSLKTSFADNKSNILKDLPISLNGHVLMPSNLKAIGLKDFRVAMKDIDCELNLQADLNNGVIIKSFDYKLNPLDIMGLIAYIPHEYLKGLDTTGTGGILTLGSEGKLTEPFSPTEDRMPSFQGRVDVTGKDIRVPVKGELISLNGLAGIIGFDIKGKDITRSFVDIKRLSLAGEGLTANASAKAERILSEHPFVNAELDLEGRLENISRHLPQSGKYALRGESDSKVKLSFVVRNIKELAIGDLLCDAEVSMKRFAVQPDSRTTAGIGNIKASVHGRIDRISSKGISGITMKGNVKTDDVALNARGMSLKTNSLNLLGNYSADKGVLRLEVDSLLLNNGVSMSTELTGTTASGNLKGDKISFDLKTDGLFLNSSSTGLSMNEIALAGSLSKPKRGANRKKQTNKVVKEYDDEEALKTVSHTPDRIRISLDPKTKEIINNLSARVNVKIGSGLLTSKAFPVSNRFSAIDITSDINHTRINGLKFHSGGCAIDLTGDIDNLTGFLSSPDGRENLHGRLRLEIDTLDIPRIARIYENGVALTKGIKKTLRVPKPPVDKSDCMALMIPRNLDIAVEASANHLLYTDLDMTDISTTLSVKNGLARIGDLAMHTAFGRGVVDVVYSSADIDRLNLGFTADITDVNLVDFFNCYRNTLLKAMPYMSNFSGDLSAKAGGQLALFPSMYFNVPSMTAYMDLRSRNLRVHQNKFIRHITRLMLIHTSKDIHIPNLKINANVHDNLVELDPFYFIFNRYTLNFSGINNFDGDMFYHIAVDRSPIPFKFGINLKGTFTHPEIRLGGPKLKADDTEKVAAEIMEEKRINMIQNLKYGFIEFLKMAAIEDTTGNQDYIFPVLVEGK